MMLNASTRTEHVRGNPVGNPGENFTNSGLNHPSRCKAILGKESAILDCGDTTIPTALKFMKVVFNEIFNT